MDMCIKMVEERKKLKKILENADFKTKEEAIVYAEAMTKMIMEYQMLGLVHEYYDDNIIYKTANGVKLTNLEDVLKTFLALLCAFPDLKVYITESFASGDETEGFKVYLSLIHI